MNTFLGKDNVQRSCKIIDYLVTWKSFAEILYYPTLLEAIGPYNNLFFRSIQSIIKKSHHLLKTVQCSHMELRTRTEAYKIIFYSAAPSRLLRNRRKWKLLSKCHWELQLLWRKQAFHWRVLLLWKCARISNVVNCLLLWNEYEIKYLQFRAFWKFFFW